MRKRAILAIAAGLVLLLSCRHGEVGTPLGETYQRIARPVIWRTLPQGQAEQLGLKPGDVILSYNDIPLVSNEDLLQIRTQIADSQKLMPLVVLRGDEEIPLSVKPGPLGYVPESERYPSSLAIALEDILDHMGMEADYDWIAALTAESFTLTARGGVCPTKWPGGLSATYLDDVTDAVGLSLQSLYEPPEDDSVSAEDSGAVIEDIASALDRGRIVLVRGGWPEPKSTEWGVVTRFDSDDSLLYGFVAGFAEEQPVTGRIIEAYAVRRGGHGHLEPEELLTTVLVQALEMGQAYADTGWQSGIAAYDLWIGALDTVPFCPQCSTGSQACFDRLIWTLRANKESANRLMDDMRIALPDQTSLIDEIIADNNAIIGKLDGIVQSSVRLGKLEDQHKLAMAIGEIELIESDLLQVYEDLIGAL